jgi:hypothetical protein
MLRLDVMQQGDTASWSLSWRQGHQNQQLAFTRPCE